MKDKIFYINNIPFIPLTRRYNAVNCRIGNSKQKVFIPLCYFNKDLTIKDNVDLNWFFRKKDIQHRIELYKKENGE